MLCVKFICQLHFENVCFHWGDGGAGAFSITLYGYIGFGLIWKFMVEPTILNPRGNTKSS